MNGKTMTNEEFIQILDEWENFAFDHEAEFIKYAIENRWHYPTRNLDPTDYILMSIKFSSDMVTVSLEHCDTRENQQVYLPIENWFMFLHEHKQIP